MSYGRSLERWLKLFSQPLRYTEWATLAQDRAEWARLISPNFRTNTTPYPHHQPLCLT